jgi:predicted transcriptional regulator
MLQEQLNLRNTTLKKMLREMQNVGIIRRVGPDKGGHWEVIE